MGWIISIAVVVFIIWKINNNGKKHWKLTIAQIVSGMFPDMIAATMSPLIRRREDKLTVVYMRVMANYVVAAAKGEQSMDAMHRDSRNVLCIIHGEEELKKMLYDKYREVVPALQSHEASSHIVSYEEFAKDLDEIRLL